MGETTGFMRWDRATPTRRPIPVRLRDWKEVYEPFDRDELKRQAGRCMDCGIPFCNNACPLGNIIPDWNDLVYRDRWREAIDRPATSARRDRRARTPPSSHAGEPAPDGVSDLHDPIAEILSPHPRDTSFTADGAPAVCITLANVVSSSRPSASASLITCSTRW